MSEKSLKFNNIRLNKKDFHKSKEPIDLLSVKVDKVHTKLVNTCSNKIIQVYF